MEIYAKKGTALEQTIKAMVDKTKKAFDEALDMTGNGRTTYQPRLHLPLGNDYEVRARVYIQARR